MLPLLLGLLLLLELLLWLLWLLLPLCRPGLRLLTLHLGPALRNRLVLGRETRVLLLPGLLGVLLLLRLELPHLLMHVLLRLLMLLLHLLLLCRRVLLRLLSRGVSLRLRLRSVLLLALWRVRLHGALLSLRGRRILCLLVLGPLWLLRGLLLRTVRGLLRSRCEVG